MKVKSEKGITVLGLILLIIAIAVIIFVFIIPTLTAQKGNEEIVQQANSQKMASIKESAEQEIKLACAAMRLSIAEAQAQDRNFSPIKKAETIQTRMLETIKEDTYLSKEGWVLGNTAENGDTSFTIVYQGEDYKNAANDKNAKITFTIKLDKTNISVDKIDY